MNLKEWAEAREEKPLALAAKLRISQSYIYQLLSGERSPGLKLANQIQVLTKDEVKPSDWITKDDK